MKSRLTDTQLMEKVAQNDSEAFTDLYNRNFPKKVAFFRMCGFSEEDSHDMAEMAFLKLWRNKGKFNASEGSFSAWFGKIAHDLAVDAFRQAGRRPSSKELDFDLPEPKSDPQLEDAEAVNLLAAAILELPTLMRKVLLERLQRKTLQEIADKLEITLGKAFNNVHAATETLQQSMVRQAISPTEIQPWMVGHLLKICQES